MHTGDHQGVVTALRRRMGDAREDRAVTVLLVDDNVFFRRGLGIELLAAGIQVVGEASNGRDAIRLAGELRPDVVVMDTDLPMMDGVEATCRIAELPDGPVVVALADEDEVAGLDAMLAGAVSFLVKRAGGAHIAASVQLAAAGESVLSATLTGQLVRRARELEVQRRSRADHPAAEALSRRECDVLRLVVAGRGNTDIGHELYISASTVKQHVASIVGKLGVENRIQAAAEAVRIGIV